MYIALFGLITLGVYAACMWMVRIEERREARRRR